MHMQRRRSFEAGEKADAEAQAIAALVPPHSPKSEKQTRQADGLKTFEGLLTLLSENRSELAASNDSLKRRNRDLNTEVEVLAKQLEAFRDHLQQLLSKGSSRESRRTSRVGRKKSQETSRRSSGKKDDTERDAASAIADFDEILARESANNNGDSQRQSAEEKAKDSQETSRRSSGKKDDIEREAASAIADFDEILAREAATPVVSTVSDALSCEDSIDDDAVKDAEDFLRELSGLQKSEEREKDEGTPIISLHVPKDLTLQDLLRVPGNERRLSNNIVDGGYLPSALSSNATPAVDDVAVLKVELQKVQSDMANLKVELQKEPSPMSGRRSAPSILSPTGRDESHSPLPLESCLKLQNAHTDQMESQARRPQIGTPNHRRKSVAYVEGLSDTAETIGVRRSGGNLPGIAILEHAMRHPDSEQGMRYHRQLSSVVPRHLSQSPKGRISSKGSKQSSRSGHDDVFSGSPLDFAGSRRGSTVIGGSLAVPEAFEKHRSRRDSSGTSSAPVGYGRRPSMLGSSQRDQHSDNSSGSEDEAWHLLPIWRHRRKSVIAQSKSMMSQKFTGRSGSMIMRRGGGIGLGLDALDEEDETEWRLPQLIVGCLNRCVVDPSTPRRLMWDLIGVFLIFYDLIFIPLQAFNPPTSNFTTGLAWLATIFWSADIPYCFVVGFHSEGVIEMRVRKIASNYIKTWLPFDLLVIGIDWSLTITSLIEDDGSNKDGIGFVRLGKTVKFLRLVRLLRLWKAHSVMNELFDRIQSEWCVIMLGISKLLLLILFMVHVIACGWYAIGTLKDNEFNWVQTNFDDKGRTDLMYKYLTSLHWSITQFTPAGMEVVPQNSAERLTSVLVIVFAMVTFSSFISAITNAMNQLRNLNRERNEQLAVLRRYFSENRIPTGLMGRIWASLQQAMGRSKRRVHERDVAILQLLPWNLKTELQEEVYAPILTAHPLFMHYSSMLKMQMRKIYQNSLREVSLGIGQELFNFGEGSETMYFVLTGVLAYREDGTDGRMPSQSMVSAGHWLCEPALWVSWKHTGQVVATTHCEFIALQVSEVHKVFGQGSYSQDCGVRKYAKIFYRYFQEQPEVLTDIWSDLDIINEMAFRAFEDDYSDDESSDFEITGASLQELRKQKDVRQVMKTRGSGMQGSNLTSSSFDPRAIFGMSRPFVVQTRNEDSSSSSSSSGSDSGCLSGSEKPSPKVCSDETPDPDKEEIDKSEDSSNNRPTAVAVLGIPQSSFGDSTPGELGDEEQQLQLPSVLNMESGKGAGESPSPSLLSQIGDQILQRFRRQGSGVGSVGSAGSQPVQRIRRQGSGVGSVGSAGSQTLQVNPTQGSGVGSVGSASPGNKDGSTPGSRRVSIAGSFKASASGVSLTEIKRTSGLFERVVRSVMSQNADHPGRAQDHFASRRISAAASMESSSRRRNSVGNIQPIVPTSSPRMAFRASRTIELSQLAEE